MNLAYLGLAIESPSVHADAQNFRPSTWPPPRDFPIVIDANGRVVSRYSDSTWDLRPWAKKPVILNFSDSPNGSGRSDITPENADLLRQISAWWLYGPMAVRSALTLRQRFGSIRSLFRLCSTHGIIASDLTKFPAVLDEYRENISSTSKNLFPLLHILYEQREQLGFTLLDRRELILLETALPKNETRQTPYIPPRIWSYQVNRLRTFLDDFHSHRAEIEACYMFCLDAYASNSDSLGEACRIGRNKTSGPFWNHKRYTGIHTGYKYHGPFINTAQRFGIADLLKRWVVNSPDSENLSIRSFAKYFTMVGYVGIAYILNFSLMRIHEACSLRADSLKIENDEYFGSLYMVCGETTKTIVDDDARWPISPSAKVALDAMTHIARLRMICAQANPDVPATSEEIHNPHLLVRSYEPWGTSGEDETLTPLSVIFQPITYLQLLDNYPCLFDRAELQITEVDLQIGRLITPSLQEEEFSVGKVWPLAWHQLRRTGAVNMQASGLVSDASIQYQLKHASRSMSLYYGKGYSQVHLNKDAQATYIRTMYEVLGREINALFSDRFISPHGHKRKYEILKIVDIKDSRRLSELAKSGKVSWRETLLGGCTKRGPCPYGGVDNIAHCGGGTGGVPCADALYDRENASKLQQLRHVITSRIMDAPEGSPYRESLESQKIAVENALNAIEKN